MRRFLSIAAVLLFGGAALRAQSGVPAGFVDEQFASGLSNPIALAVLPDGRLLCAEKNSGAINVIRSDGTVASIGTVPDLSTSIAHRGVQGIAVDPQWPTHPYVYAWYTSTVPALTMRLERLTLTGSLTDATSTNLVIGSTYVILNTAPDLSDFHNGGTIAFGPDGKLYVFMGEDNDPCLAKNMGSLGGKILRLDVSGLPATGTGPPAISAITPAGNPFTSPAPNAPLVWASGFRNPFRADIDPVTGNIFIADVGEAAFEEIDLCTGPGMNFGWPNREGAIVHPTACGSALPNATPPLVARHHLEGASAMMSLCVYRNPPAPAPYAFGPAYEGDYFFSDYGDGTIRRLKSTGGVWGTAPSVPGQPTHEGWALTAPAEITDGVVGIDGALYYTQLLSGTIRRIRGGAPAGPSLVASVPGGTVLSTFTNYAVSFTLTATAQPGTGASVTLTAFNVPQGATITPALPVSGPTRQVTFNWTPGYFDTSRWDFWFEAVDQTGMKRVCPLAIYVADGVIGVSTAIGVPTPLSPGQDFILIDPNGMMLYPLALSSPPVFPIPFIPSLDGFHVYLQAARYNPAINPTDPWKLSNGLSVVLGGTATPFGTGSGLTLAADPIYNARLGAVTTFSVTQP